MQFSTHLRSVALEFREIDHLHFGKPGEAFSVLSLSLDSRGTYEKALIWDDKDQMERAVVDAQHCGELNFWTDDPIPQLLKSQPPLAEAWIKGWSIAEEIHFESVYALYPDPENA